MHTAEFQMVDTAFLQGGNQLGRLFEFPETPALDSQP
jgi:hypothetical protein